MSTKGKLLEGILKTEKDILAKRAGQFMSRLDQDYFTRFMNAKSELEDRILKRQTLLDFGPKTTQDLVLSRSLDEVSSIASELVELNNEIQLMYISLKYQRDVIVSLFGESTKYELPDIYKII